VTSSTDLSASYHGKLGETVVFDGKSSVSDAERRKTPDANGFENGFLEKIKVMGMTILVAKARPQFF